MAKQSLEPRVALCVLRVYVTMAHEDFARDLIFVGCHISTMKLRLHLQILKHNAILCRAKSARVHVGYIAAILATPCLPRLTSVYTDLSKLSWRLSVGRLHHYPHGSLIQDLLAISILESSFFAIWLPEVDQGSMESFWTIPGVQHSFLYTWVWTSFCGTISRDYITRVTVNYALE